MTDVAPTAGPNEIPSLGVSLAVTGVDANGLASLAGLTSPSLVIDDPTPVFTFTPDPSQLSATLVPIAGAEGQATVTFSAGTTNADGTPGAPVSATYLAAVTPGNAVSVTLVATDIQAPPA